MLGSRGWRWVGLCAVVLALIILPFVFFGEAIESWTAAFLDGARERRLMVGLVLSGLLAGDILLPVPSSVVSTACGFFLGFVVGTCASLAGMMVSCAAGYVLGRVFGRPLAARLVGDREIDVLDGLSSRYGLWVVIVTRPVPVLAEAAVLFAGVSRLPWSRFAWISTFSNLGISAVYAFIGAFSAELNSFLLAFGGSIAIPAIAMALMHRHRQGEAEHENH